MHSMEFQTRARSSEFLRADERNVKRVNRLSSIRRNTYTDVAFLPKRRNIENMRQHESEVKMLSHKKYYNLLYSKKEIKRLII